MVSAVPVAFAGIDAVGDLAAGVDGGDVLHPQPLDFTLELADALVGGARSRGDAVEGGHGMLHLGEVVLHFEQLRLLVFGFVACGGVGIELLDLLGKGVAVSVFVLVALLVGDAGQGTYPVAAAGEGGGRLPVVPAAHIRCPPWRAKRRRVVPGSREATRDIRRAEGAKGDPKGASERGVQSYGRPVCSRNELAMLWRNAG